MVLLKKNAVPMIIIILFLLLVFASTLGTHNDKVMDNARLVQRQSAFALEQVKRVHEHVQRIEVSVLRHSLNTHPQFEYYDPQKAETERLEVFHRLDSIFNIQQFRIPRYEEAKLKIADYTHRYAIVVEHLDTAKFQTYLQFLYNGDQEHLVRVVNYFAALVKTKETHLIKSAELSYQQATRKNVIIQVVLFFLGVPLLIYLVFVLYKTEMHRENLLREVESSFKRLFFHNGKRLTEPNEEILKDMVQDLHTASRFVKQLSVNNYQVTWDGLDNTSQIAANRFTLSGYLIQMRDRMAKQQEDERKRAWISDGLIKVLQISHYTRNVNEVCRQVLTFVAASTNGLHGGVHLVEKEGAEDVHFNMVAYYDLENRKWLNYRIDTGDGLVREAYHQGELILLKNLPSNYLQTPGSSMTKHPKNLVIVPAKHHDEVVALVELVSYETIEPHEIEFLLEASEILARMIVTKQKASLSMVNRQMIKHQ